MAAMIRLIIPKLHWYLLWDCHALPSDKLPVEAAKFVFDG